MTLRPGLPDVNSKFMPKVLKSKPGGWKISHIEISVQDVNAPILRMPSTFNCT